jgi:hypothetical protein
LAQGLIYRKKFARGMLMCDNPHNSSQGVYMPASPQFAFDRSMRRIDVDGRLHVEISAISKALVNPYLGREIVGGSELGLDPDRVYMMLRDPAELERAAPTFNNIPVLSKHVPATADAPQKDLVVGSTGTDAVFAAPYLMNSLVVWDAVAIAGINSREQCELSSAYRYRADMTPGEFDGTPYDGVMRDIQGNHVALVEVGRAGPDVYVFDSQPYGAAKMKRSQLAICMSAALAAHLVPMLAQDAKLGDLGPVVNGVTKPTFAADSARIVADVMKQTEGKLAAGAKVDPEALKRVIQIALDAAEDDEDAAEAKRDKKDKPLAEDDDEKRDDETDEEYEARMAKKDKPSAAMDAAIAAAESRTVARMNAIRQAEKDVAPFIGEVVAQDSAEAIYKLALDAAGVKTDGVHVSAYRAMVGMLPKPGTVVDHAPRFAADAAAASDFASRFPTAKAPARI